MQDWVFHWKMLFNSDPTKKTKEFVFSVIPCTHPSLCFINSLIEQDTTQKHLGLT